MAAKRHSTIQFNSAEWLADTARMPRIVRSVYFDLCVYTWERVAPVPPSEVFLMTSDLPEGQGEAIIENLIQGEHLRRLSDGSVFSGKAMDEAIRAFNVWEAKSRGGRGGKALPTPEEQFRAAMQQVSPDPDFVPPPPPEELERQAPTEDDMREAITRANGTVEIAEAWNQLARKRGLKQIAKMTSERVSRLHARIAEHGADAIIEAIERLADNEIVLATKPTFDTILQPETCAKMVGEGCGEVAEN